MPPIAIDLIISALILGMTYALMSEGLWGSALMFFNVLFSGIIAFNFYEPLAALIATNAEFLSGFADTLCLLSLFIVSVVVFRLTTESLAPTMVRFPLPVFHIGRIVFGLAGSVVTIAIILLAYETAPVHKKVFNVVDYKYRPPFKMGIDHEWLGFFQYTTGMIFTQNRPGNRDPFVEYGSAKVFDPKSEWLLNHQDARPYGTETVLEEATGGGEAAGAGTEGAAGGTAQSGPTGGAGGGRPGDIKVISPAAGGGVVIPPS